MPTPRASLASAVILLAALAAPAARAQNPWDLAKKAAGAATTGKLEKEINDRLLAESRKNQCSFKTGTDVLAPGCDAKMKKLAQALITAKKQLNAAGVQNFKFEASGHTDTTGDAAKNKALSQKRAEVVVKQLVEKGIPASDITAVGRGSEQPQVTPDNTEAKRAKNRRYELRVRL